MQEREATGRAKCLEYFGAKNQQHADTREPAATQWGSGVAFDLGCKHDKSVCLLQKIRAPSSLRRYRNIKDGLVPCDLKKHESDAAQNARGDGKSKQRIFKKCCKSKTGWDNSRATD